MNHGEEPGKQKPRSCRAQELARSSAQGNGRKEKVKWRLSEIGGRRRFPSISAGRERFRTVVFGAAGQLFLSAASIARNRQARQDLKLPTRGLLARDNFRLARRRALLSMPSEKLRSLTRTNPLSVSTRHGMVNAANSYTM
jgi:hypothetical protein